MEVSDCVDAALTLTLALSLDREGEMDTEAESKKSQTLRVPRGESRRSEDHGILRAKRA